ncbi:MAG TPA: M24 family metallopeptidase [Thermoanaerobaculia bacterium]|nr:M24 family metallopeptidase [Thermoanaerobaculia bacterium]
MERSEEIGEKAGRLEAWLAGERLDVALLRTQANFSWMTGGRSNAIDLSQPLGVATLLVARGGRRWVIADAIEMDRLLREELPGQWRPVEIPWAEGQADPDLAVKKAREVLGTGATLAADWPVGDARACPDEIRRLRSRLTPGEIERLRALGRDAGEALGEVCRNLRPGLSEVEIARRTATALADRGADPVVLLVGAGERLERFRHPVPTAHRWDRGGVMVVACPRREGLTVALTRIVWAGPVPEEIRRRTQAAARVNARLLAATRAGVRASELFAVAARAYAELGFPREEERHHQGGAIGYLSRDWIAHPESTEVVESPQAFAWNPSITGTKVEETWIVDGGEAEAVTCTPGWPGLEVEEDGRLYKVPDVVSTEHLDPARVSRPKTI